MIWSLSDDAREIVSYAQVVELERAAQFQSPMAGLVMVGLGVFLILGSRMRAATS